MKEVTELAGGNWSGPHNEDKQEDVWNGGDPLGQLLHFLGFKSMENYNCAIQAGM